MRITGTIATAVLVLGLVLGTPLGASAEPSGTLPPAAKVQAEVVTLALSGLT